MSVFDRLAGQEDVVTQLRAAARAARAMIVAADGTSTTGGTAHRLNNLSPHLWARLRPR